MQEMLIIDYLFVGYFAIQYRCISGIGVWCAGDLKCPNLKDFSVFRCV